MTSVIPSHRWLRQEDHEFEDNLGYIEKERKKGGRRKEREREGQRKERAFAMNHAPCW